MLADYLKGSEVNEKRQGFLDPNKFKAYTKELNANNPYKRWKLILEDIRNRDRWADYEIAINDMLAKTSTEQAAWHLIAANHKWYTRVTVLEKIVEALAGGVDITPPAIDRTLIETAMQQLGIGHALANKEREKE